MTIENELKQLVESKSSRADNAIRNASLIADYYGLGDLEVPTYEKLGDRYGITRERVRQIIDSAGPKDADLRVLPAVDSCAELMQSRSFWRSSELVSLISERNLSGRQVKLGGILSLVHAMGLFSEADTFDLKFEPLRRIDLQAGYEFLVARRPFAESVEKAIRVAAKLPRKLGLATLPDLRSSLNDFPEEISATVIDVLPFRPHCRFIEAADALWYTLEDRDNTLINRCEKVFSIIDACDVSHLSEVLANSLASRSQDLAYPSAAVIERFIRNSPGFFSLTGETVTFLGRKGTLTAIESDLLSFLGDSPSTFVECDGYLGKKGYKRPSRVKAICNSPLVFADKSAGRTRYRYCVIRSTVIPEAEPIRKDVRYDEISLQLKRLQKETDIDVETQQRREQGILRRWLFGDAETGICAICGEIFSVNALVAAHKKKRAICSADERLDPYIVMPLCKFGCDYLYETEIVAIVSGKVARGKSTGVHTAEHRRCESLLNRHVPQQWLVGDPAYLDSRRRLTN